MAHYNQQKNPPWVRNNVQQQPILAQQMTVQSVALSQPTIATTHITPQNSIGQVQITPAIQSHQVQLPVQHLLLNPAPAFGQQVQLANIATSQQPASTHQTYFTPSISLQQNVGLPQGTIQIQPSSLVIPSSVATSIAPPGLAITTTLATVHPNTTATYTINRLAVAPPQVPQPTVKQRVFSGIVTKLHENFGFIDEDVIFQSSVVKGTSPQIGDRVLVEASFNGSMPFKWNATRVQVIAQKSSSEPIKQANRDWTIRSRDSDRLTPKSRESRSRKSRSRSPQRRTRRYSVQIPKVSLDYKETNLIELRRRYSHLYIPSDFVSCTNRWVDSFPIKQPFPVGRQVDFHIFEKDVDSPIENGAIFEPDDADYSYCAKVMLASLPSIEEFMKKCCPDEDSDQFVHPARLIRFLVGQRGKNESMAIGGPWSPSLDGQDPANNPQTLVKTAIRTCRALTGIDLSVCTRWYRATEISYRRKDRTETVVIYVPDVWSAVPTRGYQWEDVIRTYVQSAAANDQKATENEAVKVEIEESGRQTANLSKLNLKSLSVDEVKSELEARNLSVQGDKWTLISRLTIAKKVECENERQKREEVSDDGSESPPSSNDESSDHFDFAANPKILVHPSKTFKGGKFNCAVVSLSVLLDYRLEDTKEHMFEVSLFSESFNEMLMRDFGLLVYQSVVYETQRKDAKKKEADDDSDKSKRKLYKDARLTINSNVPPLLAYSYFDLGHCNYIASKDLEDLFLTLGLQLSRAQVRKLLQKVVTDDCLRYRKLVEKISNRNYEIDDQVIQPAFNNSSREDCVNDSLKDSIDVKQSIGNSSNGCFVNVEQLIARLEQCEESRRQTETQLKSLQSQLAISRSDLSKADDTIASLSEQLSTEKLKTEDAVNQLNILQENFSKYSEAILKIQKLANSLAPKTTADDNHIDDEK